MKSKKRFKTVDEYMFSFPKEIQNKIKEIRKIVKKEASEAEEKISYNMPFYSLHGRLLYFAVHENHIGFYALPSAIVAFKNDLKNYETSKGTVRFPLDKPIPVNLVRKIVKYRIKENLSKK
ncbi:Uncharacterised protein [uncultured archaeon]|nr:Uncharacterised protein [uncultured archaeon]